MIRSWRNARWNADRSQGATKRCASAGSGHGSLVQSFLRLLSVAGFAADVAAPVAHPGERHDARSVGPIYNVVLADDEPF
jgi:hypothetical protein